MQQKRRSGACHQRCKMMSRREVENEAVRSKGESEKGEM